MRIAFYAPMKPPDHPLPSGDREMARQLFRALTLAGHTVEIASRLRSRDPIGDKKQQNRLKGLASAQADRLINRYRGCDRRKRPQIWFTYHLYYKAPDWIGPRVASRLKIPYVVAEASVAYKRAGGPWAQGHEAVMAALEQASAIVTLNPADAETLPDRSKVRFVNPFLDPAVFQKAHGMRQSYRDVLEEQHGLDDQKVWLLAVGMMRHGDKLESYRVLAQALRGLPDPRWHLIIVGDGPAKEEVINAFAWARPDRVTFLGQLDRGVMPAVYAACDVLVWPAISEAYGMALLEAQAAGLPVVAGRSAGVAAIVRDRRTGMLSEPGSAADFAAAARSLLTNMASREMMSQTALREVKAHHGLQTAAVELDAILRSIVDA